MPRKRTPTELDKAEIKLRSLLDKRNQLNEEANAIRQERDLLHEKKSEIIKKMKSLKEQRDSLVKEMRLHKLARNKLHSEAKNLIDRKRKVRGKLNISVSDDLKTLRKELDDMEMKQQTESLTLAEENELVDEIRDKYRELIDMEKIEDENVKMTKDVGDINVRIDDLFKRADEEHQLVIQLSKDAQKLHEQIVEMFKSIATLVVEANKKHEEFIKIREKADNFHKRAQEMRRTVLKTREDERRERREAKDLIKKQSQTVRKALLDEKKLDEAAEESLKELMKKGKVEMKG